MKRIPFFVIYFFSFIHLAYGQYGEATKNVSAYGVQMGFTSDRSKIRATEVASNVLYITNGTGKTMSLDLQINAPAGWKLYTKVDRKIVLKPNDTLYFPLRVRPAYQVSGNTNYVINVFLSSESFTIANSIWYVEVEKISNWSAYTPSNKKYFTNLIDSTDFSVVISNDGNSDEALQLRIALEKDIIILDMLGNPISLSPISVYLKGGQDTTLTFTAKLLKNNKLPEVNGNKFVPKKDFKVKLKVLNEKLGKGNNREWSGSVDFYKVDNSTKIEDTRYNSLPFTIELNTYDALSDNTYNALSIYGNRVFKNSSVLNYYFQANFIKNQLNTKTYLGDYQYIGYTHKRFSIELGDLGMNMAGSVLSGKGAKASVNIAKNTIGAIYVQRPSLFKDFYASGFGVFHHLDLSKFYWASNYQHANNAFSKITTDVGTTRMRFRLGSRNTINLGGGYSIQKHMWDSLNTVNTTGYGANLTYSGSFRNLSYGLSGNYGSPQYVVMRGSYRVSPTLRYRINRKYSVAASYSLSNYNPEIFIHGHLDTTNFYSKYEDYSFKLNYTNGRNNFIFNPTYHSLESSPLFVNTGGMNIDYRFGGRGLFRFYSTTFLGYSYFPLFPELKEIFVAYIRASIRYKKFQASVRYNYGPYYQMEQIMYINTQENPQKIFINGFYEYWFLSNKMRLDFNLNYSYNTIHKRQQLNLRPELYYFANSGFRFSLYGRYIVVGEGEYYRTYYTHGTSTEMLVPSSDFSKFEFGAGIKFNVNVPISFKKNYDVEIIAFKDINGNGVKDHNETGIPEMLIHLKLNDTITNNANVENQYDFERVKQYDLATNGKGSVEYKNIPLGDYVITATPLTSLGGWFDGKTFYRTIDEDKKIFIPLSRGARLSGGIIVERDKYGMQKKINLGDIRVTAVNQNTGKQFSTLTSSDGSFVLFIPNGDYIVMINESAVSKNFSFMQNDILLLVNEEFENYNVSFYLAENKRNINIRGKRSRRLPINRTNGSSRGRRPAKEVIPEQKTQLEDPNYLPVVEPTEEGTVWLVQLYPDEGARMLVTAFDTLKGTANIRCITGQNGGFLYITDSYAKKKYAKKLMKQVSKKGYDGAQVVSMVFGNKVVEADTTAKEEDKGIEKTIKTVDSEEDRAFYRIEIKVSPSKLKSGDFMTIIPDLEVIYEIEQDGLYKYAVGQFDTSEEAKAYKKELIQKYGLKDAFVTQYKTAW